MKVSRGFGQRGAPPRSSLLRRDVVEALLRSRDGHPVERRAPVRSGDLCRATSCNRISFDASVIRSTRGAAIDRDCDEAPRSMARVLRVRLAKWPDATSPQSPGLHIPHPQRSGAPNSPLPLLILTTSRRLERRQRRGEKTKTSRNANRWVEVVD